MQVKTADNLCVICGNVIPEGRQACPNCEAQIDASANRIMSKVNDEVEQAFREGYIKGKSEDSRIIQIANHYGYTAQREQFEEECGEAIVAAQKCKRDGSMKAFNDLCGEVADVLIMARQMRLLMSPSLIDAIIESKLDRQMERIADETTKSADSL